MFFESIAFHINKSATFGRRWNRRRYWTQPLLRTRCMEGTPSIRLVRTTVRSAFILNCIIIIQIDMPVHNITLWFNAHRHTGHHLLQPLNVSQWKTDCLCISHLCICAWSATPQPFVNTKNLLHFRCSFINKFEYIFQLQLALANTLYWCCYSCHCHCLTVAVCLLAQLTLSASINEFPFTCVFPSNKSIILNANAKQAYFSNRHRINSKLSHNELILASWKRRTLNASKRRGRGRLCVVRAVQFRCANTKRRGEWETKLCIQVEIYWM